MENIKEEVWRERIAKDKDAVILDVRTPMEWQDGVLKNAILINFHDQDNFLAAMESMDKSKNFYIYCKSGQRSAYACKILDNLGANHTYNLIGGIIVWKGETHPYQG
ncbi:rhodanese-like domain-containing protein [Flavobacteriaceae bacterium Ap0902]|nr:rhodanese-like domain-containing protein [Flavobacteriaceae bacterium Ap0902]